MMRENFEAKLQANFRVLAVSLVLTLTGLGLNAQDFGVTLDTQSVMTSYGASFDATLLSRTYFWFDAQSDTLSFSGQGSYRLTLSELYFFDLDHLFFEAKFQFTGSESTLLSVKAGRFAASDFSLHVLNHTLDGISLEYENAMSAIQLYFGFSGSLWDNLLTTVEMSRSDNNTRNAPGLHLEPPRLIGMLGLNFPEIAPGYSLDVSLLFQQDFNDPSGFMSEGSFIYSGTKGGFLNTQYSGIGIHGAPASFFFFDLFSYFGTGTTLSFLGDPETSTGQYQYKPIYSALAGASLRLYFESALFSTIGISGVFATGDEDYHTYFEGNTSGFANMFVPISHLQQGVAFDPDLGNIFFVNLEYSILPFSKTRVSILEKLQTMIKGIVFFRSTPGEISVAGVNKNSSSLYLGTEADLFINWRPVSDVGFSAGIGCFFPDAGSDSSAFEPGQANLTLVAKMELSVSM